MRALVLTALLLFAVPACAEAAWVNVPVGSKPLADRAAAKRVVRSGPEIRPENHAYLKRVPSAAELAAFRGKSDMPYAKYVTGNFRGTTDEVLQWAGHKWGLDPDLVRSVAVVESYWQMDTVGDSGNSFGLMQMRRPFHCCFPLSASAAAFNVDYWAAIVRAYYDGEQKWLYGYPGSKPYGPGDIEGSIKAWATGRWWNGGEEYLAMVSQRLGERLWESAAFTKYRDKKPVVVVPVRLKRPLLR